MALKVAVQMDHISSINIAGDSAFALMLEAQARGHELHHYTPDRLALKDGKVFAALEPVAVRDEKGNHFTLGEKQRTDLSQIDVILMRQDPPFDMAYVAATHLLERSIRRCWWSTIRPRCATRPKSCSSPNLPT